ncbi:MAG: DegV family protein [Anaerolineales bacterium]|nr:DegV family protein [Anaerolineales bacterium]
MNQTVVVTDSTAHIPPELLRQYGIQVAPLAVVWDGKTLHDGLDITPEQFYARLKTSKTIPTTSQTTPEEFIRIFAPILAEGKSILGVFISSRLSGTVESAVRAKQSMPDASIEIVDSMSSAMAEGFAALAAARSAQSGARLAEAAQAARQAIACTNVVFVVDTLEFLHRGGRIGGAQRFLGTALNLKPLLTVREGKVEALESVRTKKKATERMLDLVEAQVAGRRPLRISPLHASALEEAQALMHAAQDRFQPDECILSEVSPTIGTHVGPGTIGLAYCAGI